ncbi:MAG: hypothetical protein LRY68_01190 [Sulfurospirillum sp.]|nr:hypothetical protein [Sulfurospirillum sp.]
MFILIEKEQPDKEVLPHIQLNAFKKSLSGVLKNDGILFKYQPSLHVKEQKKELYRGFNTY